MQQQLEQAQGEAQQAQEQLSQVDQAEQQLKAQGTDIHSMRNRLRANMSWMRLVNAKFGRFVDVSQKTIDESVAETQGASSVSLHLHRLTFQLPEKIDQRIRLLADQIDDALKD